MDSLEKILTTAIVALPFGAVYLYLALAELGYRLEKEFQSFEREYKSLSENI